MRYWRLVRLGIACGIVALGVAEVAAAQTLDPPTGLAAQAVSQSSILLRWGDPGTRETSYEVERSTGGGAFTRVATLAKNSTGYMSSGLAAATTYSYRVRAVRTKDGTTYSAYSAVASATTKSGTAADTTLPTVSITSPTNGANYTTAQTVTIQASASDNVGVARVEFRRNGALVATDTTSPYATSWSVGSSLNGAHTWQATAFDAAGNSRSAQVSVTVSISSSGDTTLPTVSITSPVNGTSYTSAQTVTVQASASDNVGVARVEFRRNGALVATDAASPYATSWSVDASQNGTHTWQATAFDAAGNARSAQVSVTVSISSSGDTTLPTVSITSPANGSVYTSAGTVSVQASATDNVGVTRVEFRRNGTLVATGTASPYSTTWSVDASQNGTNTWQATAFDAAGNSRSAQVSASVAIPVADATLPTVSITSPANGTSYTSAQTVTLQASATDNVGVTRVEFRRNGALVATDTAAPYAATWSVDASQNGSHTWQATAFDAAGNSRSAQISVTVSITGSVGQPDLVGFLPGVGFANAVAVDGAEAFVASAEFGLSVLDITSPSAPDLLGSAEVPFLGLHTAVRGNRAVVAGEQDGYAHFWVLDVSNTAMPLVVGELATSVPQDVNAGFQDIALDATGARAVAAKGNDGLWVIDLSNPAAPRQVGSYDTPGQALGVALDGSVAYVADLLGDLQVVSVADPTRPSLLASMSLAGGFSDVAVAGAVAYLVNPNGGFTVVDVSDPRAPRLIAAAATRYPTKQVVVEGTRLVVLESSSPGNSFQVFDVSSPATPRLTATVDLVDGRGVALAGGLAYVADGRQGLEIHDVRFATPPLLGAFESEFEASIIAEAGGIAVAAGRYLPTNTARLQVIDATSPANPVLVSELATSVPQDVNAGFQDIALDATGARAVAAKGNDGLWVIDLSNPAAPRQVGSYDTPGQALGVALDGSVAYVADLLGDLQVVSVADPTRPSLLASMSLAGGFSDVAVAGAVAYLVNPNGGFTVVDVSDPRAPRLIAAAATRYPTKQVVVEGTRLVVLESSSPGNSFQVFDVSAPATPRLTATVDLVDGRGVALAGGLAYVADGRQGLEIYDLRSGLPALIAQVAVPGDAAGVSARAGRAYVATAATVAIVD